MVKGWKPGDGDGMISHEAAEKLKNPRSHVKPELYAFAVYDYYITITRNQYPPINVQLSDYMAGSILQAVMDKVLLVATLKYWPADFTKDGRVSKLRMPTGAPYVIDKEYAVIWGIMLCGKQGLDKGLNHLVNRKDGAGEFSKSGINGVDVRHELPLDSERLDELVEDGLSASQKKSLQKAQLSAEKSRGRGRPLKNKTVTKTEALTPTPATPTPETPALAIPSLAKQTRSGKSFSMPKTMAFISKSRRDSMSQQSTLTATRYEHNPKGQLDDDNIFGTHEEAEDAYMGSKQDEEENPRFRFSPRQELTNEMRSKWDRVWKDFKQEVHNNDYSTFEKMVVGQETEWEKNALQTQHKTGKGKGAVYVNEYNNDWESKTAKEQERDAEIWRTISGVYKGDRVFDSEQARVLAEMYSGLGKKKEAMQKELDGARHGYASQKTKLQQYNNMSTQLVQENRELKARLQQSVPTSSRAHNDVMEATVRVVATDYQHTVASLSFLAQATNDAVNGTMKGIAQLAALGNMAGTLIDTKRNTSAEVIDYILTATGSMPGDNLDKIAQKEAVFDNRFEGDRMIELNEEQLSDSIKAFQSSITQQPLQDSTLAARLTDAHMIPILQLQADKKDASHINEEGSLGKDVSHSNTESNNGRKEKGQSSRQSQGNATSSRDKQEVITKPTTAQSPTHSGQMLPPSTPASQTPQKTSTTKAAGMVFGTPSTPKHNLLNADGKVRRFKTPSWKSSSDEDGVFSQLSTSPRQTTAREALDNTPIRTPSRAPQAHTPSQAVQFHKAGTRPKRSAKDDNNEPRAPTKRSKPGHIRT